MADKLKDLEDGTYDADPVTLAQVADQFEAQGLDGAANMVRESIPMTKSKLFDNSFIKQMN